MSYPKSIQILDSLRDNDVLQNDPNLYTLGSGLAELAQTLSEESREHEQRLTRIENLLIEIRGIVRP